MQKNCTKNQQKTAYSNTRLNILTRGFGDLGNAQKVAPDHLFRLLNRCRERVITCFFEEKTQKFIFSLIYIYNMKHQSYTFVGLKRMAAATGAGQLFFGKSILVRLLMLWEVCRRGFVLVTWQRLTIGHVTIGRWRTTGVPSCTVVTILCLVLIS